MLPSEMMTATEAAMPCGRREPGMRSACGRANVGRNGDVTGSTMFSCQEAKMDQNGVTSVDGCVR